MKGWHLLDLMKTQEEQQRRLEGELRMLVGKLDSLSHLHDPLTRGEELIVLPRQIGLLN